MRETGQTLNERSVGELLSETFSVYARNWKAFLILAAVVQAPIAIINQMLGGGTQGYIVIAAMGVFGSTAVYGAGISAVGQHYTRGSVDVKMAYRQVQWRYLSMLMVTLALGAVLAAGIILSWIIVPLVVAVVYGVYWSVAGPVVMFEGLKPVDALKKSHWLIRGNWWRVFGAVALFLLVALGMGFVVALPFQVVSWMVADGSSAATAVEWLGAVAAAAAVPPVLAIAWTLLYFDLRYRKEEFSFEMLENEKNQEGGSRTPVPVAGVETRSDDDSGPAR